MPTSHAVILPGGNENHVVRVSGDRSDIVVRFARDGARNDDPFDIEAWSLRELERTGVSSSRLVARGWLDDTSYLVVDYVPGAPASADDLEAWRAIGEFIAALSHIDTSTAPEALFSRFGRDLDAAWDEHLAYNLSSLADVDPLIGLGVYAMSDRKPLHSLLSSLRSRSLPQGIVHGDLSTRNVVADDGYVIIDWGTAQVGPTLLADLERIRRWMLLGDEESVVTPDAWGVVLSGAGLRSSEVEPVLDELTALHALDVVRWALDRRPDRLDELAAESTRLLRLVL
nr:aminoglycoside phosphotransferase family protein [Planctomonas sp. JC2975]